MKRLIPLLMALLLCACSSAAPAEPEAAAPQTAAIDDMTYQMQPGEEYAALPGGAMIACAVTQQELKGRDARLWQGTQSFAMNFGYTAQRFAAPENTVDGAERALRDAAESGAQVVVCGGETMAAALYRIQENYPSVCYLLLDAEPHSEDYAEYSGAANVHSVLFREEEAAYLAGCAAVENGMTRLAYITREKMPENVRYFTGFLQGAEAAAERRGEDVSMNAWFCASEREEGILWQLQNWFETGVDAVMTCDADLEAMALEVAGEKDAVLNVDAAAATTQTLYSAVKCYNAAVQQQLHAFFSNGGHWAETSGSTTMLGVAEGMVGITAGAIQENGFTQKAYNSVYTQLQNGTLTVSRYSDLDELPTLSSVALHLSA